MYIQFIRITGNKEEFGNKGLPYSIKSMKILVTVLRLGARSSPGRVGAGAGAFWRREGYEPTPDASERISDAARTLPRASRARPSGAAASRWSGSGQRCH
jgi:hypothetical protein